MWVSLWHSHSEGSSLLLVITCEKVKRNLLPELHELAPVLVACCPLKLHHCDFLCGGRDWHTSHALFLGGLGGTGSCLSSECTGNVLKGPPFGLRNPEVGKQEEEHKEDEENNEDIWSTQGLEKGKKVFEVLEWSYLVSLSHLAFTPIVLSSTSITFMFCVYIMLPCASDMIRRNFLVKNTNVKHFKA